MKCPLSGNEIPCTEHCRDCAKELYEQNLTKEEICHLYTDEAFEMLVGYGFIKGGN
jgi:hypothetical protein